jgi:hypothetical protein
MDVEKKVNVDESEVNELFKKVVQGGRVVMKRIRTIKHRMSPKQKMALLKAQRRSHTGAAKLHRAKSMVIHRRKLGEGVVNVGVSALVSEAFDIDLGENIVVEVKEGYMFALADIDENVIALSVYDENGEVVKEGIEVDAEFVEGCFSENLVESLQSFGILLNDDFISALEEGFNAEEVLVDAMEEYDYEIEDEEGVPVAEGKKKKTAIKKAIPKETDKMPQAGDAAAAPATVVEGEEKAEVKEEEKAEVKEEEKAEVKAEEKEVVEEAVLSLSYDTANGYSIIREGKKCSLGSRVRARAFLLSEGVAVDFDILERAKTGESIKLK